MQSGFTGGGGLPDFYTAINGASQPPYGRSPNLPGLFLDQTAQRIARQSPHGGLIGKRTLAEFQSHQSYMTADFSAAQASYLRAVKPRMYQHSSPISPLSPIEFSPSTPASENSSFSALSTPSPSSQRFGLPILHQFRPQSAVPYARPVALDSEKKMMSNKLQELEKQLLDDLDDDDEADPASAITTANRNSDWSETIQNLIVSPKPPVSPSSQASSSSSSASVASPATAACAKQSILDAATAISEGRTDAVPEILARLHAFSAANPRPSSDQKAMEFMASALRSRVSPAENPPPVMELFGADHAEATQSLYDLSPCFTLAFSVANLAILDATLLENTGNQTVHVVDFDVCQGGQYANLLHAIAARQKSSDNSSLTLKITAVTDGSEQEKSLMAMTEKLTQLGEKLGVRVEIKRVSAKVGELSRETLGCSPDEPIAVNLAFKLYRFPDESVSTENPRDELLRRVKALAPRVAVVLEQELNTNTAPFATRVGETCAYYGAVLDSIDATARERHGERARAEEAVCRKVANSVACEGRERVERCEVHGKWRARLGMAGFEASALSQNVTSRLSSMGRVHPSFAAKEENGGVCFGWMGRTLTVASAWR